MKFQEQECPESTPPFSSEMLKSSVKMIPNTMHIMKGFFVTVKSPKLKIDNTAQIFEKLSMCLCTNKVSISVLFNRESC